MLYYFYATEHPMYLSAMQQLKIDLISLDLPYVYDTYKHESRFENLLLRPAVLLKTLQKHMCPIVSLDVDCRILSEPVFKPCDIACRMYNSNVPILGTLYLEPTQPVFSFLHEWYHLMLKMKTNQQQPFRVLYKDADFRKGVLPNEYAVLKCESEQYDHPIIIHDYISRKITP